MEAVVVAAEAAGCSFGVDDCCSGCAIGSTNCIGPDLMPAFLR